MNVIGRYWMRNFTNDLFINGCPMTVKEGRHDGGFLHKFFNSEINHKCTPLIIQLPQQILDEHPPNKRFNFLLTIHVPLKDNNCIEKNHDGVHTMNEQPEIMMLKDVQLYCCRGINKSCSCRQLPMKTLSF